MESKELALAMDFKKAPKEIQDAATKHWENCKALNKAVSKQFDAGLAVESAQKAYEETAKTLRIALKAWNPEV